MTHETIDYIQQLRSHGYRVTSQRLIVLDAVCETGGHGSLNDILARVKEMDPSIDRSTVYRALDVLSTAGLIVATELGKEGRIYCLSATRDHHHLICEGCGQVLSIPAEIFAPLVERVGAEFDFEIRADHLALPGRCHSCRRAISPGSFDQEAGSISAV